MDIRERLRQCVENSGFLGGRDTRKAWELVQRLEKERDFARGDRTRAASEALRARADVERAQAEAATLRTALEDAKADLAEALVRENVATKSLKDSRESEQQTLDALTQCAKERNRALEQVKALQARVEEDAEEIVRLRDAYDVQGTQLRRLKEKLVDRDLVIRALKAKEEEGEEAVKMVVLLQNEGVYLRAKLHRLRETLDALTGPSAPKPSFGCHVPGVPPRVVYVASGPVQKGDAVHVVDRAFRAALNCSFTFSDTDRGCSKCGDPMRFHAPKGRTLEAMGYIVGDHPAWVASLNEARLTASGDRLVKSLEVERDQWINRALELEDQLRRVREIVR